MAKLITQYDDGAFYSSGTITGDGSSAVLPFGDGWERGALILEGTAITTDETLDLTADFFYDGAGAAGGSSGHRVTFTQLTASVLRAIELLPGDMTGLITTGALMPLPPFVKFNWTLAGTTKSMAFTIRRHLVGDFTVREAQTR